MNKIIALLSLQPILFGLIGMLLSGITFPIAGVIVVRNGLVPMRYMLMHGVILGGIISIALKLPLIVCVAFLNVVLVLLLMQINRKGYVLSNASSVMMVCTMGIASLLSHIFDVPAKDTLEVFWGSPFALTPSDLTVLALLSVLLIVYVLSFFREICAVFFDKEIATTLGINVTVHNYLMMLFTALIISVAMKVLGALLIDALLILPAVIASKNSRSLKEVFIRSSVTGLLMALSGYFAALLLNIPVSGVIAVLTAILFAVRSIK